MLLDCPLDQERLGRYTGKYRVDLGADLCALAVAGNYEGGGDKTTALTPRIVYVLE